MSMLLPAIAGSIIGGWFSKKASDTQQESAEAALAWQKELAGPALAAMKWGFPYLQNLLSSQVGKRSPLLWGQYKRAIADIGRGEGRNLARSRRFWRIRGNEGAGRGEEWRIRLAGEQARGATGMEYAGAEEGRQTGLRGEIANLIGLGGMGMQPGMAAGQSMQNIGAAKASFWGDMGSYLSDIIGTYEQQQFLKQLFASGKTGTGGGGGSALFPME